MLQVDWERYGGVSLREVVFDTIRAAILVGRLQPGQRITEEEISNALGVSRSPVREGVRKLEQEGFLSVRPGRGIVVATARGRDLAEEYELRLLLEPYAARQAAEHISADDVEALERATDRMERAQSEGDLIGRVEANVRFHATLVRAAHNRTLVRVLDRLWKSLRLHTNTTLSDPTWARRAVAEHRELIEALRAGDAGESERLCRRHIESARAIARGLGLLEEVKRRPSSRLQTTSQGPK